MRSETSMGEMAPEARVEMLQSELQEIAGQLPAKTIELMAARVEIDRLEAKEAAGKLTGEERFQLLQERLRHIDLQAEVNKLWLRVEEKRAELAVARNQAEGDIKIPGLTDAQERLLGEFFEEGEAVSQRNEREWLRTGGMAA